jgi:hypothetical protein
MAQARKIAGRLLLGGVAAAALYALLLCFPQPFFGAPARVDNLALYSDRPLPAADAERVLRLAAAKLDRSPLYSRARRHAIFVCNSRWRQAVFFNRNYGAGGVNYYPVTNVFLRDAHIEENRLISPLGTPVGGDRTLDYYVAHEIAHSLVGQSLGLWRFMRLPSWVSEGYADYVGKGGLDYEQYRQAFLAGAPEMDYSRSGLYRGYHLLVALLLDRLHWTVRQLLESPPDRAWVESEIRAGS